MATRTVDGYRVGSQPPSGYIAWHEWAAAQAKGGLKQKRCPVCLLWKFPQEKCEHGGKGQEGAKGG